MKRPLMDHLKMQKRARFSKIDDESHTRNHRVEHVDLDLRLGVASGAEVPVIVAGMQADLFERDQSMAHLLGIFPDLCPIHAANQLAKMPLQMPREQALQAVTDYYLAHGVVKAPIDVAAASSHVEDNKEIITLPKTRQHKPADMDDLLELKEPPPDAGVPYYHWSLFTMAADFPRVKMAEIRQYLRSHKGKFGPAYRALYAAYQSALAKEVSLPTKKVARGNAELKDANRWRMESLNLMKHPRCRWKETPGLASAFFEKEYAAVRKSFAQTQGSVAGEKNERVSPARDIECGCCCSEYSFEEMVQCADGHLFCSSCLRRHVEESMFGSMQTNGSLPCMDTNGCTETFPWSEVKRTLPAETLLKYEQRQAEDAVARARLEGLIYCPFCNLPWQLDPGVYVLECPNEACKKASCIRCKEPSHVPLRCEEVETVSETALRKRIEEVMTKALVRVCSTCQAELVKQDGCNKITCRCGETMCYVCRKPIAKNYKHFCQHALEPGKHCTKCEKCNLWQKEIEDDVVKAAKKAALKQVERLEPGLDRHSVGPQRM